MAIRCLFYTPGNTPAHCQVLQALAVPPLEPGTQQALQDRYCQSGSFIACPIFSRIEESLIEANRLGVCSPPEESRDLSLPSPG